MHNVLSTGFGGRFSRFVMVLRSVGGSRDMSGLLVFIGWVNLFCELEGSLIFILSAVRCSHFIRTNRIALSLSISCIYSDKTYLDHV